MTLEQAIEKAIKGGWRPFGLWDAPRLERTTGADYRFMCKGDEYSKDGEEEIWMKLEQVCLDPLFWQALGKALGWDTEMKCPVCWREVEHGIPATAWMCHWHRFIDHLAMEKSAESFFADLK